MKNKLLYETPQSEVCEVVLEGACLQVGSLTTNNPDNPMPWDDEEE